MKLQKVTSYSQATREWLLINSRFDYPAVDDNPRLPFFLFAFCLAFYCLYLLTMQPGWVLGGEMWAESAPNYYINASSSSIAIRFFSTDAGYIPLPQRILAFIFAWLKLPAAAIPYFYTWSGILITAAMVGAFCLAPFRALVRSDWLRLYTALAVLMIADFETRTFISFTYFAAFFVAIVTALAFVERRAEVPRWAWAIPVLMMSKPAVLSAAPALVVTAFVSKKRFRLIAIFTVLMCLAQLARMYFSPQKDISGALFFTTPQKIEASLHYFLGFFGALVVGKSVTLTPLWATLTGAVLFIVCLLAIVKARNGAGVLILVGLSLLLFNIAVHCFALSANWNVDMQRLVAVEIERHIVVSYAGVVLAVAGLAVFLETVLARQRHRKIPIAASAFAIWFVVSGWLVFASTLNRDPGAPKIYNSQWQAMAAAIDSGQDVCVPVDPVGLLYQRNCGLINSSFAWINAAGLVLNYKFAPLETKEGRSFLQANIAGAPDQRLLSIAVLLKVHSVQPILLDAEARLQLADGQVKYLKGSRQMPASGGMIMMTGKGVTPLSEITSIELSFSAPADLGYLTNGTENMQVIYWMGN